MPCVVNHTFYRIAYPGMVQQWQSNSSHISQISAKKKA
jgi:hypothetical protein